MEQKAFLLTLEEMIKEREHKLFLGDSEPVAHKVREVVISHLLKETKTLGEELSSMRETGEQTPLKLTFGIAVKLATLGYRIARDGWNGKGMHVSYKKGGNGTCGCPTNPYFVIKNVNGSTSTWVPSINDTLAEDWTIVE